MNRQGLQKVSSALICLALLSAGQCKLPPTATPCECPVAESDASSSDLEALLSSAVENGSLDEDSEEYQYIASEIAAGRDSAFRYFGTDFIDLGYPADGLTIVPSNLSEQCAFEIRWKICFEVDDCRSATPPSSGEYSEVLVVRNTLEGISYSEAEDGGRYETFEREPLAPGECREYGYPHPGLVAAEGWEISIGILDRDQLDCDQHTNAEDDIYSDEERALLENDSRALQLNVVCPCDNQELLDIGFASEPEFHASDQEVAWNAVLNWEQCRDHAAESKVVEEVVRVVRSSDGATLDERTESFSIIMGASVRRSYSTRGLATGSAIELTIEFSGPDCACDGGAELGVNNRKSLVFTP